jgi:hypothetical protein
MKTELEAYEDLLCGHVGAFVHRLRKLPPAQFDWSPAPAAPTARILAAHTYQWLVCDRYHLTEPNARLHPPIPEPPQDTASLINALAEENENWRTLLRAMRPEDLDTPRLQFNQPSPWMTCKRDFICHMIQNSIYKHGQFSTLFFALGHDGTEPYTAPFPNAVYEELFGPRLNK